MRGQYFLYENLAGCDLFEPSAFGTDGEFLCNATNNPGFLISC